MTKFQPTDCLLALGRRGCGKSHLTKSLQRLWPRRIILDSLGEYASEFKDAVRVSTFDQYAAALTEFKQKGTKKFVLIFQFDPENVLSDETFDHILRLAFYLENVQVVIEEVQNYSSPHFLPHWLKTCLLVGRHKGLSLFFTTQRPGELHKTILSQCHHVFCGQITEGNDVRYLAGSALGAAADRLPSLKKRRFLWVSDDGVQEIENDVFSA